MILILRKLSEESLNEYPNKGSSSYGGVNFDSGINDPAWLAEALVVACYRGIGLVRLERESNTGRLIDVKHVRVLVPTVGV